MLAALSTTGGSPSSAKMSARSSWAAELASTHWWCTLNPMADMIFLCPLQPPVPVPTPNPCLTIDPHCTSCSGGVCTACNIIFTLDNATKKCGEPQCSQLPEHSRPALSRRSAQQASVCMQHHL